MSETVVNFVVPEGEIVTTGAIIVHGRPRLLLGLSLRTRVLRVIEGVSFHVHSDGVEKLRANPKDAHWVPEYVAPWPFGAIVERLTYRLDALPGSGGASVEIVSPRVDPFPFVMKARDVLELDLS